MYFQGSFSRDLDLVVFVCEVGHVVWVPFFRVASSLGVGYSAISRTNELAKF